MWALLSLKQMLTHRFYIVLAIVQPLFLLAVAAWLAEGEGTKLAEAVAGTTVMGMWSAVLFGAGRAMQRERRAGTMEFWLIAPRPLLAPLSGVCLGAAALGLVSATSAVAAATAFFGYRVGPAELALFGAGLLVGVPSLAALGVLLAGLFVVSRQAAVLTNMLEYPVWFACALAVPAGARPGAVAAVGELLAPTHVATLLRGALVDGQVEVLALVKLVGLSALGLVLAVFCLRRVGEVARRHGDLAMA